MKLQTIVAAVALTIAGVANASINQIDGVTANGDSSLLFVNLDSTGATTQSLTIDLGYNFSQFKAGAALAGADQKVVWDFNANTITQNGTVLPGITNAWSDQRASFLSASDAGESKWAILAGSSKGTTPNQFLATGNPTPLQLTQQNAAAAATFPAVNAGVYKSLVLGSKGTTMSADNGAYAAASTDSSYVGTGYNLTTSFGWKGGAKFSTWSVDGAQTNLTQVNANGTEVSVADSSTYVYDNTLFALDTSALLNAKGTFTYSAALGTLTWETAKLNDITPSVPEPQSYVLALLGLAAIGFAARRRSV